MPTTLHTQTRKPQQAAYPLGIIYFLIYSFVLLLILAGTASAYIDAARIFGTQSNSTGFKSVAESVTITAMSNNNLTVILQTSEELNMSCTPLLTAQPAGVFCSFTYPGTNITDFTLKDPITQNTTNLHITVDSAPPTINLFQLRKTNGQLLIDYAITDTASPTDSTHCSGISSITITADTDYVFPLNIPPNTCTANGTLNITLNNYAQDNLNVFIHASDGVGLIRTANQSINGHFLPPVITPDFMLYTGQTPVTTLSNNGNPTVDVVVRIDDATAAGSSLTVTGDLSALNTNPAFSIPLQHASAVCTLDNASTTVYNCKFAAIPLHITNTTLSITIFATNQYGFSANSTITKTFDIQNTAGTVTYIGPYDKERHCTSDLADCYTTSKAAGLMTLFSIEFDGTSNYSMSNVRLGYATGGVTNSQFTFCNFDNTSWACTSPLIIPQGASSVRLFVAYPSTDDYGNPVPNAERLVHIDDSVPVKDGNVSSSTICPTSSETLTLSVAVNETQSPALTIWMNTSAFTSHDTQEGTCATTDGEHWQCTIDIKDFITGHRTVPGTRLIVQDLAGNQLRIPYNLEICEPKSDTAPNVVSKITAKNTLSVDRRTASRIPVEQYVMLSATLKSIGAQVMDYTITNCYGTDANGYDVMATGHYMLTLKPPVMAVFIGGNGIQLPEEPFTVNCTLDLKIRSGSVVYTQPERETVIITINPYNNPFGVINDSIQKKIDQEKESLRKLDSQIGTYKSIDNILGNLCNIAEIVVKFNSMLQTAKSVVIYPVAIILNGISGPVGAIGSLDYIPGWGDVFWLAVGDGVFNNIDRQVQHFVWPTGIDPTATIGYAYKFSCMVYTCQFYKTSGIYTMVSDIAGLVTAHGRQVAQDALAKQYKKNIEYVDDHTIIDKDSGQKFTRSADENGLEVWTSGEGSKMTLDPKTNQWSIISAGDNFLDSLDSYDQLQIKGDMLQKQIDGLTAGLKQSQDKLAQLSQQVDFKATPNDGEKYGTLVEYNNLKDFIAQQQTQINDLTNQRDTLFNDNRAAAYATQGVNVNEYNPNSHSDPLFEWIDPVGKFVKENDQWVFVTSDGAKYTSSLENGNIVWKSDKGDVFTFDSTGDLLNVGGDSASSSTPIDNTKKDVQTGTKGTDAGTGTGAPQQNGWIGNGKEGAKWFNYYRENGKYYKVELDTNGKELSNTRVELGKGIENVLFVNTAQSLQNTKDYVTLEMNNIKTFVSDSGYSSSRDYLKNNGYDLVLGYVSAVAKGNGNPYADDPKISDELNNQINALKTNRPDYYRLLFEPQPMNNYDLQSVKYQTYDSSNPYYVLSTADSTTNNAGTSNSGIKLIGTRSTKQSVSLNSYPPRIFQDTNTGQYFMYQGDSIDLPIDSSKSRINLWQKRLSDGSYAYYAYNPTSNVIYPVSSATTDQRDFISGRATDPSMQTPAVNFNPTDNAEASNLALQRDMKFYAELESNDWIINPYRSVHYDSACIPAILYNKQKEKQIRCKYLSCLEKQSSAGIPTITCEKDYEMDTCLYIDSAQWKFEDVPFMSALMSGMIRSGLAFATSLGVQSAYSAACSGYNSGLTSHTLPEASWSALPCGMTGLFLRWREVEQVFSPTQWKGITTSSRPDDPATIHDYCQGVDYSG